MKVGDRVKIVRDVLGGYSHYIGRTAVIEKITNSNDYPIHVRYDFETGREDTWLWTEKELVVINKENNVRKLLSKLDESR